MKANRNIVTKSFLGTELSLSMSWDSSNRLKLAMLRASNPRRCHFPNWFQTRLWQLQTLSGKFSHLYSVRAPAAQSSSKTLPTPQVSSCATLWVLDWREELSPSALQGRTRKVTEVTGTACVFWFAFFKKQFIWIQLLKKKGRKQILTPRAFGFA